MCPIFGVSLEAPARTPAAKETIHKTFKDPATADGSEEEQLMVFRQVRMVFRQVRDEIKEWIAQTFVDQK